MLKDFQKRILEEKIALDEKIQNLAKFLTEDVFKILSDFEKDRLYRQFRIMNEYSNILNERIINFLK